MFKRSRRRPTKPVETTLLGCFATFTVSVALTLPAHSQNEERQSISFDAGAGRVDVYAHAPGSSDRAFFTSIHLVSQGDDGHVPYLYPVLGPGQVPLTRNWPMKAVDNEERDHPHHRSLWFAHGAVDDLDFWTGRDGSRIEHQEILDQSSGPTGRLVTSNHWLSPERELVVADERSWQFRAGTDWRTIDLDITLESRQGDLVLGDTKEGTFAVRLTPELRLTGPVATGHCVNDRGATDGECWGKRARWVSYQGEIDGRALGVAIFDHPENLRHPSWWHARDYGLFAANPFGIHDFAGQPEGTGDYALEQGRALHLRYRVLLHQSKRTAEQLEKLYQEYLTAPMDKPVP